MEVEVERKFRLAPGMERAIRERFKPAGKFHMEDTYYFSPELLPATDFESFAVRLRRREGRTFLQLKGVRGEFVEMSTELDPATAEFLESFFPAIGLQRIARVAKEREVFEGERVKVMVDGVEGLGDFVEVESKGGELADVEEAAAAIGAEGDAEGTYLMALLEGTEWTQHFVR